MLKYAIRATTASALFGLLSVTASGCGYSWQNHANPWKDQGVETIYVRTLTNNTLKPGIEVKFTSAIIRELSRGGRVRLVQNENDADAVLIGVVDSVGAQMSAETSLSAISKDPAAQASDMKDIRVAAEYSTSVGISVHLNRRKDNRPLWSQTFGQPRLYPANNRFGNAGTTSTLINASQQDLALDEIAEFIAADLQDALFEAF